MLSVFYFCNIAQHLPDSFKYWSYLTPKTKQRDKLTLNFLLLFIQIIFCFFQYIFQ